VISDVRRIANAQVIATLAPAHRVWMYQPSAGWDWGDPNFFFIYFEAGVGVVSAIDSREPSVTCT